MNASKRYSPEVRERAVRLVREAQQDHGSQWAAIVSISSKIGCTHETLRSWVRQAETEKKMHRGILSGSWVVMLLNELMCISDCDRVGEIQYQDKDVMAKHREIQISLEKK